MWYKLKRILIYPDGVTEKQVYPAHKPEVYFNFWDWTNSTWTTTGTQWTVTKYSDRITFYNSSNVSQNYLSQYPIDCTKDFLLEYNAAIPNTSQSYHYVWLSDLSTKGVFIGTRWENANKFMWNIDGTFTNTSEALWQKNFFIKKEWDTLSFGWDDTVKYTGTYTFPATLYLYEQVYRNTLTIYTAKLTYL